MNYYLYIIIHLTILTTTLSYPLEWEFQTFPTQPDTGFVASLLHSNPSQGIIVAFENDDGTTWEARTIPADLPISKGGRLIWVSFHLIFLAHGFLMTRTNFSFS